MNKTLFSGFLVDEGQYRQSEGYWVAIWEQVDQRDRDCYQWSHPWLGTGSPALKDGNPIFDAYSPVLRRAVRVVQLEPIDERLDIQAYLDSFGGDFNDPESVIELVIACTLSEEAARIAQELMKPWVAGETVEFDQDGCDRRLMSRLSREEGESTAGQTERAE